MNKSLAIGIPGLALILGILIYTKLHKKKGSSTPEDEGQRETQEETSSVSATEPPKAGDVSADHFDSNVQGDLVNCVESSERLSTNCVGTVEKRHPGDGLEESTNCDSLRSDDDVTDLFKPGELKAVCSDCNDVSLNGYVHVSFESAFKKSKEKIDDLVLEVSTANSDTFVDEPLDHPEYSLLSNLTVDPMNSISTDLVNMESLELCSDDISAPSVLHLNDQSESLIKSCISAEPSLTSMLVATHEAEVTSQNSVKSGDLSSIGKDLESNNNESRNPLVSSIDLLLNTAIPMCSEKLVSPTLVHSNLSYLDASNDASDNASNGASNDVSNDAPNDASKSNDIINSIKGSLPSGINPSEVLTSSVGNNVDCLKTDINCSSVLESSGLSSKAVDIKCNAIEPLVSDVLSGCWSNDATSGKGGNITSEELDADVCKEIGPDGDSSNVMENMCQLLEQDSVPCHHESKEAVTVESNQNQVYSKVGYKKVEVSVQKQKIGKRKQSSKRQKNGEAAVAKNISDKLDSGISDSCNLEEKVDKNILCELTNVQGENISKEIPAAIEYKHLEKSNIATEKNDKSGFKISDEGKRKTPTRSMGFKKSESPEKKSAKRVIVEVGQVSCNLISVDTTDEGSKLYEKRSKASKSKKKENFSEKKCSNKKNWRASCQKDWGMSPAEDNTLEKASSKEDVHAADGWRWNSRERRDSGFGSSLVSPKDICVPGMEPEANVTVFDFLFPSMYCGRLIGKLGKSINLIKDKTGADILLHPQPYNIFYQVCTISGTKEQVEGALAEVQARFPPDETLTYAPLKVEPEMKFLTIPEGISVDVVVSSVVDGNHVFLQQPTHPSFPALEDLNYYMTDCYTQDNIVPQLPRPIEVGSVCAAPAFNNWFRAQVVEFYEETDEVDLRFTDYGGYSRIKACMLRQIRSDFTSLPFQASECFLSSVAPIEGSESFSPEVVATLEGLVHGRMLQAEVIGRDEEQGIPYVSLQAITGNEVIFINRELANLGVTSYVETVSKLQE